MRATVLIFLVFAGIVGRGQSYIDAALMYARTGIEGTARTTGMANAYGSVGADLGCININPAGIGLYRSTDFSITPEIKIGNNEATYNGSHQNSSHPKVYFTQAGVAWNIRPKGAPQSDGDSIVTGFEAPRVLRSMTFALNIEGSSYFYRSQQFGATNSNHSMIDNYVGYVNQTNQPISFNAYPPELVIANAAGLFQYNSVTGYYSNVRAPVIQNGSIDTKGGVQKINLAYGANLSDKVFLGFGIAVPILSYSITPSFSENSANGTDSLTRFQHYDVQSELSVSGYGFTANLGVIYRPVNWVRIGASYQLPTWYSMSENYSTTTNVDFDTASASYAASYPDVLRYKMRLPMKGTASASFYLKQAGFISFDYEFQNFGATHYRFPDDSTGLSNQLNKQIKDTYKLTHTFRVGIEGSIKVLRLRAGYAYQTSPFKKDQFTPGYPEYRHYASAGIGVRLKNFYADFAYVLCYTKDASYVFASDPVYNTYLNHSLLLTVGWKLTRNNDRRASQQRRRVTNVPPPPMDDNGQRY